MNDTPMNSFLLRASLIYLFILLSTGIKAQVLENKAWCKTKCNAVGDEMANTKSVFMSRGNQGLRASVPTSLKFPLRIVKVRSGNNVEEASDKSIRSTVEMLNKGFEASGIKFNIDHIRTIQTTMTIEDLHENAYTPYNEFSDQNDVVDMISVYIFDYDPNLCEISPTSISCGRTGGFSYILSERTNNIVLSSFDVEDDKVIVHEMGHFFGLYHTFEEFQFGKDNFVEDCNVAGDCICDTPPDPGPVFEVYVNHSKCEMLGFANDNGHLYKPMINNYMAYYKPCYLQSYVMTSGQNEMLMYAASSPLRMKFSR